MPQHPSETIKYLEGELRALMVPVRQKQRQLTEAYEELRKLCVHNHLIKMRGTSWGDKHMCANCGLIEDEAKGGSGFHVLKDRGDVWMKRVSTRHEWDKLAPARTLMIGWCYGDACHPAHYVPIDTLTKGRGTRCAAYTGSFE